MERRDIYQVIVKLIENESNIDILKEKLLDYHPYDLALAFIELDNISREKIYKIFTNEEIADIFEYIDEEESIELLEEIDSKKVADILNEMSTDDAVDILNEMDTEKAEEILDLLDLDVRKDIEELTTYEDETAGAIMNNGYLEVLVGSDVKEVMKHVVQNAPEVESINTLFIVNEEKKLLGTLDLKKLIITKAPALVDDVMNTKFQYVDVNDSIEDVAKKISDYDIYDMPVLENGIIKGIITMDDAADALIDANEEDYARFAGLTDKAEIDDTVWISLKKRIPWLVISLVLNILISVVISKFDYLFDELTVLVLFQAVILGLAGNCGTQSLAVSVRKIGNDVLNSKTSVARHLSKEFGIGLFTGFVFGIISFGLTTLLLYLRNEVAVSIVSVGMTVGLSIFLSLALANLFGSLMPLVFYKLKIDPAAASGPFITTLNDVVSVIVYYTLATLLLYNFL